MLPAASVDENMEHTKVSLDRALRRDESVFLLLAVVISRERSLIRIRGPTNVGDSRWERGGRHRDSPQTLTPASFRSFSVSSNSSHTARNSSRVAAIWRIRWVVRWHSGDRSTRGNKALDGCKCAGEFVKLRTYRGNCSDMCLTGISSI